MTMLSDEKLLAEYHDAKDAGANHFGSLRAVEAAVRADQIEKDAAIAESEITRTSYSARVDVADAIRAQLEGADDE